MATSFRDDKIELDRSDPINGGKFELVELVKGAKPSSYRDAAEQGFKGTLIGSGSEHGGSSAFDANVPQPVIVDPGTPQQFVQMPGALTRTEAEVRASGERSDVPAGGFDKPENQMKVRSQLVRSLKNTIEEARERVYRDGVIDQDTEEPAMARKTVKPKLQTPEEAGVEPAAPPAPELPTTPETRVQAPEPARSRLDVGELAEALKLLMKVQQAPADKPKPLPQPADLHIPETPITFMFEPPYGAMETRYHDIFKESNALVLVWDQRCTLVPAYTPAVSPKFLKVKVGNKGVEMQVLSLGITFVDEETRKKYIVLLVNENAELQAPQEIPHGEDRSTGGRLLTM